MQIWDRVRPRMRRDIVEHRQVRIGQLDVVATTENLTQATDWGFAEDSHKIVVHLDGRLNRMECEFSVGPSGTTLPNRGDIWIIPAGCRYAALAQGDHAKFVELTVPTRLLADASLIAQVGFRDDFLFSATARLYSLLEQPDDDISIMAAQAISHALSAHMVDVFRSSAPKIRKRRLSTRDKALLAEAIKGQLDASHSLGTLAALVGMSVRQFTPAFRDAFGMTPWQYVLRARLESAALWLRKSDVAITEIALAAGFATSSHFATSFINHFGVRPSHYRALAVGASEPFNW